MQWNSMGDFLHMGGSGAFVWGSFGACALLLALEVLFLRVQKRASQKRLRRLQQMEEA